jgi:hypothetical protein
MTYRRVHFVLVGEGSSDEGLIPHLENLCIAAGADEVTGTAPDFDRLPEPCGRSVADKLRAVLQLEPEANLIFIHRDADAREPTGRLQEIQSAVEEVGVQSRWVPVVPVQETEAWLLLDEKAIRTVAENPSGRVRLNLPRPAQVERLADPKSRLQEAILTASGAAGRRLERLRAAFPQQRLLLLSRLPIGGPLEQVSSWRRVREGIQAVLHQWP